MSRVLSQAFRLLGAAGVGAYVAYPQVKTETEFYYDTRNEFNRLILENCSTLK